LTVVDGKDIIVKRRLARIAELKEEWDEDIEDPESFTKELKHSGVKADIFTFMQRLPESKPKYNYHMEWDSIAAIPITSYDNWYKNQLHQNPRNKMRIAEKKGVIAKLCEFNDELVEGIKNIYNETPIRQDKYFPLYRMDFNSTRKAHITFLDRSCFIGAFINNELIGFLKLASTEKYMRTMGILAKVAHRDKAPMNLLVAKAVEICAEKKMPYFIYAKFNYGKRGSETLKEFKKYLGFESIILPRYYIPLNVWGKIILKLKLHREIVELFPKKIIRIAIRLRSYWYSKKFAAQLRTSNYAPE